MSIRVLTLVWDSGAYEGGTLLVLLAMADHADDTGGSIFPTIRNLGRKARLSPRQVHNCITILKDDQMIGPDREAPRAPSGAISYRINVAKLRQMMAKKDAEEAGEGSANIAGGSELDFRGGMQPNSGGDMQLVADNNHHSKPSSNRQGPADAGQPSKPKGERTKKTVLGDWKPGDAERAAASAYWQQRGRADLLAQLDDQIDRFLAHHRAAGSRMADWSAAWQTWYSRALADRQSFAGRGPMHSGPAPSVIDTWVSRLELFHHGHDDQDVPVGYWDEASYGSPPPGAPGFQVPSEAVRAYAAKHPPRRATG